jgi:hypothetical protein
MLSIPPVTWIHIQEQHIIEAIKNHSQVRTLAMQM